MQTMINQPIMHWLHTMGYSVSGMPREAVEAIFLREAQKWDLAPERLEAMVREGYGSPQRPHAAISRLRPRYASGSLSLTSF